MTENECTATKWATVADKAAAANALLQFIEQGMPVEAFLRSRRLYDTLQRMFGHSAHYDREGFAAEWFDSTESKTQWLEHVRNARCGGDPAWTWCDVEEHIQEVLDEAEVLQKWQLPEGRLLTDEQWVTLIQRGLESDFRADGRGELKTLISLTIRLATEETGSPGVNRKTARRWLNEFDYQVRDLGFLSGPTCQKLAGGLRNLLLKPPTLEQTPEPDPVPDDLDPLTPAEWLELLRLSDAESPTAYEAAAALLEAGGNPNFMDLLVVHGALEQLTAGAGWRPSLLLTRAVGSIRLDDGSGQLDDIRILLNLTPFIGAEGLDVG